MGVSQLTSPNKNQSIMRTFVFLAFATALSQAVEAVAREKTSEMPPEKTWIRCDHRNDGDCDDGGSGSDFSLCPYGSDELDCRRCTHKYDGDCDDGGYGSEYNFCPYGSDEPDCGRYYYRVEGTPTAKGLSYNGKTALIVVGVVGVLGVLGAIIKKKVSSPGVPGVM